MTEGVVRVFHADKGYGFIRKEGEQFFVHHKALEMEGFRTLLPGDKVTFEIVSPDAAKKPRMCTRYKGSDRGWLNRQQPR